MSQAAGLEGLFQRLAAGEIPEPVRLAAARGALPLPPAELLRLQAYLALKDTTPDVRDTALTTLREAAPAEVVQLLDGEGFSLEAAELFSGLEGVAAPILIALSRHPDCEDELVLRFTDRPEPELVEALLLNQVRLGRSPELVDALEQNPALSPGQQSRLQEIRKHLHEGGGEFIVPERPELEPDLDLAPEDAAAMAAAIQAAEAEEKESRRAARTQDADGEESQEELTAYQKVINLTPGQRVKLAFKGSSEERALLIRDPNRVVCTSVLKSPRLNASDIETYVKMRSLNEEVLRIIGTNRDWLRKYPVVLGLIRNPKTPPGISLKLLSRLQNRDLNILGGDRNIAEVVRQQARRNFVARTSGGRR